MFMRGLTLAMNLRGDGVGQLKQTRCAGELLTWQMKSCPPVTQPE